MKAGRPITVLAASVGILGGALLVPSLVMAAGSGYAPPPSVGSPGNIPSGFTSVSAAKTVTTSGGTVSVNVSSAKVDIKVPAGAFSSPTVVTVISPNLGAVSSSLAGIGFSGNKAVAGVGVTFRNSSGHFVNPSVPVRTVISSSNILSSDKVIEWTGAHSAVNVASSVTNGQAVFSVTKGDPDFAVLQSSTVRHATSPVTGKPIARWSVIGLTLLMGGGVLWRMSRTPKRY